MNGKTVEELKEMLDTISDHDLPDEITRRLLAIMILTNTDSINTLTKTLEKNHEELTDRFIGLEDKFETHAEHDEDFRNGVFKELEDLKEDRKDNPTIIQWVKVHPKKFGSILLGLFLLFNVWFVSGIRYTVVYTTLNLLRLPTEFIETVLEFLFK